MHAGHTGVLSLSTFSVEAGSLTESRARSLARLAGQQFPRILPSLSISTEISGPLHGLLLGGWEFKLRFLHLCGVLVSLLLLQ